MILDSLAADRQLLAISLVREAARGTVEDLDLARRQRREQRRGLLVSVEASSRNWCSTRVATWLGQHALDQVAPARLTSRIMVSSAFGWTSFDE
jgi:hypothetical protein